MDVRLLPAVVVSYGHDTVELGVVFLESGEHNCDSYAHPHIGCFQLSWFATYTRLGYLESGPSPRVRARGSIVLRHHVLENRARVQGRIIPDPVDGVCVQFMYRTLAHGSQSLEKLG